ncbi:VCBS repeat-containing protein [Streptomyces sp. NPDC020875]|uniref:FG-GAP repeat domain-containing protein n=1 Tax=Streptomyces sp. NPDC020875 TaxID=3154898 RepID=UPI0034106756
MSQPPIAQHKSGRGGRGRLTTAAAVALAVTAGPLALMSPAVAAPGTTTKSPQTAVVAATANAAATASGQSRRNENPPRLARGARVLSAGQSGYLVRSGLDPATGTYTLSWVRTSDGSVTPLKRYTSGQEVPTGWMSDVVVLPGEVDGERVTLTDLSAGAPGTKTVISLSGALTYRAHTGSTVIASDGARVELISKSGGAQTGRQVTGLPAGQTVVGIDAVAPDAAVVRLSGNRIAVVDLATAAVTSLHEVTATDFYARLSVAVSATRLAWLETPRGHTDPSTLVVVDRTTGAELRRTELPHADWPMVALSGDRVLYGTAYDADSGPTAAEAAINAAPVGGGTPVKILDRAFGMVPAPDGSVLVTGGTVEREEGVYRVADTAAGPSVTKVASSDDTTRISFRSTDMPAVVNLDSGVLKAHWEFSRHRADFTLTLEQPATGVKHTRVLGTGDPLNPESAPMLQWDGTIGDGANRAYARSGRYKWTVTATPHDGIGPSAEATGTIDVRRSKTPHDWTDNGSPDVLVTDGAGRLWRQDTHFRQVGDAMVLEGPPREQVGGGWGKYNRIQSIGTHHSVPAFIGRDAAGDLWLHHTDEAGGVDGRATKIGWGWQTYTGITGGGRQNADDIPDVVAVDGKGDLYLHTGTNSTPNALAARKKVGWGWDIDNEVESVGDIAGTSFGDLVARDTAGVLWLYQGKADGTFEARIRIGGGWNEYTQLVGIGDADRDGRADLYAYGPNGRTFFYAGTGNAAQPFKPRTATTVLATDSADYKIVF